MFHSLLDVCVQALCKPHVRQVLDLEKNGEKAETEREREKQQRLCVWEGRRGGGEVGEGEGGGYEINIKTMTKKRFVVRRR